MDIAERYDYAVDPKKKEDTRVEFASPKVIRRHAFMLCHVIPALNEAAVNYKQLHCQEHEMNLKETLVFHDSMEGE